MACQVAEGLASGAAVFPESFWAPIRGIRGRSLSFPRPEK